MKSGGAAPQGWDSRSHDQLELSMDVPSGTWRGQPGAGTREAPGDRVGQARWGQRLSQASFVPTSRAQRGSWPQTTSPDRWRLGGTQQVQEAQPVHRPSSPRHGVHALGCAVASKVRDRPFLCS